MLETLRAYGRDRLADAAEDCGTSRALARHALGIAEDAAAAMQFSGGEVAAARWLDAEDASLHQALSWSLEHDTGIAQRLAMALTRWWNLRGRYSEAHALLGAAVRNAAPGGGSWSAAQYWLGQAAAYEGEYATALAHYTAARDALETGPSSPTLALVLGGQANMLNMLGRHSEGLGVAARALTVAREVRDPCGECSALLSTAQAVHYAGDLDGAVRWITRACQIDPALLPGDFARDCNTFLTQMLTDAGDLDAARTSCTDLLALSRQAGDLPSETVGLFLMADLELRAGNLPSAREHLRAAVGLALEIHDPRLLICLPLGAELSAAAGRWADVVTLYAARRAAAKAGGEIAETTHGAVRREELTQRAARELGPGRAQRAEQRGCAMSLETAAEFLLLTAVPGQQEHKVTVAPRDLEKLSPRERELVALVASGCTDAQIASRLHISVSTVRSHLERIRDKTSCRRRADLTRLARHAGPG